MTRDGYIRLDTAYGAVAATPTSEDHIYVTTNPGSGRQDMILPITINGRDYKYASAHLYRVNGVWSLGDVNRLGLYFDDGTESARRKLAAELVRVVAAWTATTEGKVTLREAERASLATKLERAEDALKTHRQMVHEDEKVVADLHARLTELDGKSV